ncbi:carboxypeptidase regulatory-like domain-containing protein [Archangium violaceum]|uniref:carboxypeptidase regulatory-like domain-containing protein n=1 Tax=Archangium violaceum TaxID=83451 RepID=UPI001951473E|nr:carboxypeptidase regulatory-like domain-containing protein [Archangium violaceum]QRO01677.1 carboxypeptidase regulatory-like domain-containing protein [Archangium violaceum]
MNPPLRQALCAVLLCTSLLWSGCSASSDEPPGPTPPTPDEPGVCQVDQDCPDPGLFFCDTVTSRCLAACRTQEDCTAAKRGEYRLAECDGNPLGCRCDNSRCEVALCSADAECAASGKVCRDGGCVQAPEASAVASCRVTPDFVIGREGTSARFSVLAVDGKGGPVVVPTGATWAAVDGSVRGSGAGVEASFVLAVPTEEPREAVVARVGKATCAARVVVLGVAVAPGQMRAVVTDEQTGRPIPEAVVVTADAQGVVKGTARTDASGVALLAALEEVGSVSVFHEEYGYLTVAHEGEGSPRDVALPLRRNPADRYGGYKGTFLHMPTTQDMHAGLAGLSSPDAVTDLSTSLLVGQTRRVSFTSQGQTREVTLPAGAYVVLPGTTLAATDISAQGLAGACDATLGGVTSPEEAMAAGECGTRTAWALGGDIPLSALPLGSVTGSVDVGQLLARTIPLLRTFSSSVKRDVQFRLKETPGTGTGEPDYGDQAHFTGVDHDFAKGQSLPLGFQFAVRVPALPKYRGVWMDSAGVLGVARVAGRGVVPLGLGMGANTTPADPNTDTQAGLPGPGLVSVRMAPTHHGLEGSPYEVILTASSSAATNDATAGAASSVLIHRTLEKLPFDPKGGAPVTVSGPFLPVPEGFRYNYNVDAAGGLEGRQLRFVLSPESMMLPAATVLRAVFTNREEHRWVVLMDVGRAGTGVRLPVPPAPFEDRTYYGDVTGSRAPFGMQALVTRRTGTSAGAAVDLNGLVEADGVDLEHLGDLTVAYSALEYGRPLVTWVTPGEDGQSVKEGSKVKVQVRAFRVGSGNQDEGYVKLTFMGGTGCEGNVVNGQVVDSQGRGEVELLLPGGCRGSEVQLTATLVDTEGNALSPGVTSTRSVTITP